MAGLLLVPEVATGDAQVVISDWLVKAGDQVSAGDAVAVVETDKAVVEIEAESDATLLRILAETGSRATVGTPIALMGSAAEAGSDLDQMLAALGWSPDTRAEPAMPADAGAATDAAPTGAEPDDATRAAEARSTGKRTFISPLARKMLKEAGLTADQISGTGPHGRIRRRDVEAAISAARGKGPQPLADRPGTGMHESGPASAAAPGRERWTDIPHSRVRRAIATRLTQSKQSVPHFYLRRTVRLDPLLTLRRQLNETTPAKLSINDFILRAIALAHTTVPDANVVWTEHALRRFETVDIAVAIASERGLVTPVLREVEKTPLTAISAQVKAFVAQANAGQLQQRDLEGGSITISNLGMFGVDEFSAIINPPQSAILAVGAAAPAVQVVNGQPAAVTEANLVLSVDHRAIDGALAAQWMTTLVDALQTPLRLLV
jgi:pyruvate dehydrogenase E2 component (dihydrolipoamide acetyltransferase)